MRDVAYVVHIRLENEHGTLGLAAEVGKVIHQMIALAQKEGILSAGASIASAHLIGVELLDAQPGDCGEEPAPEISVGGDSQEPEASGKRRSPLNAAPDQFGGEFGIRPE